MRRIYDVVSVCCWIYFVGVFVFFSLGGGLAAINTRADFQHKAVEESWRAWVSVVRNQPDAPKWIQSDNAKFEESIVGYIPKVLADATVGRGRFASNRLKKNEVILLDHDPKNREYSGANWNSVMMLNLIAASYLGNFARDAEKTAHFLSDEEVKSVGNILQGQLLTKYGVDYTEEIGRAISDIKIYANRLNLYNFISSMCAIKYRFDKMPVPEGTNAAKLPDLSNYLAPGCWTSQEFDANAKVGSFTIQMATVTNTSLPEGQNMANWSITGLVSSGKFWGYALPNASKFQPGYMDNCRRFCYASLDRDMKFASAQQIWKYSSQQDFWQQCCLPKEKINGIANVGGSCYFNATLQVLHGMSSFRNIIDTIFNNDMKTSDNFSCAIYSLFKLIENNLAINSQIYEICLKEFIRATNKSKGRVNHIVEYLSRTLENKDYKGECPQDVFRQIIEFTGADCVVKDAEELLTRSFRYPSLSCSCYEKCGSGTQNLQKSDLFLGEASLKNFNNILNDWFKVSEMDLFINYDESGNIKNVFDNKPYCKTCGKNEVSFNWTSVPVFPSTMIWTAQGKNQLIGEYPETFWISDAEGIKTYELVAQGIAAAGAHIWARIKLNDGKWVEANDSRILNEYGVSRNGKDIHVVDGRDTDGNFVPDDRAWVLVYEQR
ncbi:MAG: ubiquitin carboxyl-terminal hydrolase [Alphaproteobacteria bacterium]|nr:ubiquitin carboxyl-terminal hydrolase [Alphaproteobacteria bacterium]